MIGPQGADFARVSWTTGLNSFDSNCSYPCGDGTHPFGRHMDQFSHDPLKDDGAEDAAAQRNDSRDSLLLVAQFRIAGSSDAVQVRIRNLSVGGLMAEVPKPIDIGTLVEVDVRGIGWVSGRIAWVAAGRAGVAFDHLIDPQAARRPVGVKAPVKDKPIKPLF